ncbi:galactokinase family protein [Tautonia sociabilis]|uniref:Galactokinase n=1 Tax=Tautonia sociabilis TaxID=2080755 RepID=A0A432MKX1_9BACT|nr:galactokinase family protein [Tautonia sociabilis]RUL87857.1 hypothetical protein TsocGM_09995 [Tautonia sociabilis]
MPPPSDRIEALRREAARRTGAEPSRIRVVRAPYRICPIGAHIDHQLGPVTAMAIDRSVLLAFAPSGSSRVRLESLDFEGMVEFSLDDVPGPTPGDWGNFPRGAVLALRHRRHEVGQGIVGVVAGELLGGGVSSSAAVGIALLLAIEASNGLDLSSGENIALARSIENDYLGLRSGILDQAAILLSRLGHLTLIDCASGEHEHIPSPASMPPFRILLAYSGLRRALVGTDYNRRVDECAEAARTLLSAAGRGEAGAVLGHLSADEYAAFGHLLSGPPARRAAHYFSEVDRVRRGVAAWRMGDLAGFGALMTASGESSIRNYECGSPPLIDLYEILVATEGVLGTRFSGAGFRGCCVALVDPEDADQSAARVRASYSRRRPELAADAPVVLCDPDDGAGFVD